MLFFRAYFGFNKFIQYQGYVEEEDTAEETRFSTLVECVFILSKIGRLDIISKYYTIEGKEIKINNLEFKDIFISDKTGQELLRDVKDLITAIECYQSKQWEKSIEHYYTFLSNRYQVRIFN